MTGDANQSAARIMRAQAGDRAAMDETVRENLALVKYAVKRFRSSGREWDDLYQLGCMGLVKAIKRFDASFGVCFSTYAVPVILGEVRRYLRDDGPIRVSRSIRENAKKALAFTEDCAARGVVPTLGEVAEATGLSREDALLALDALRPPRSLSEPVEQGGTLTLGDTIGEDNTAEIDRKIEVDRLLSALDERERAILRGRYFHSQTQSQLAARFGMTQVQVSRLETRLLKRLRELAAAGF